MVSRGASRNQPNHHLRNLELVHNGFLAMTELLLQREELDPMSPYNPLADALWPVLEWVLRALLYVGMATIMVRVGGIVVLWLGCANDIALNSLSRYLVDKGHSLPMMREGERFRALSHRLGCAPAHLASDPFAELILQ